MISFRFLDNINVALHMGSGEVDLGQFITAASSWREHERFTPDTPVVYDLVAADIILDWEAMKAELPICLSRLQNSRNSSSRTAWVVGEDIMYVVVESVHMAMPWTTEWRAFSDADAAVAWVRAGVNVREKA